MCCGMWVSKYVYTYTYVMHIYTCALSSWCNTRALSGSSCNAATRSAITGFTASHWSFASFSVRRLAMARLLCVCICMHACMYSCMYVWYTTCMSSQAWVWHVYDLVGVYVVSGLCLIVSQVRSFILSNTNIRAQHSQQQHPANHVHASRQTPKTISGQEKHVVFACTNSSAKHVHAARLHQPRSLPELKQCVYWVYPDRNGMTKHRYQLSSLISVG